MLTAKVGLIARSKDDALLDLEVVQQRLSRPPDQECTHPESGTARARYDCLEVPLSVGGPRLRLVLATHPASASPPSVGVQREGIVYELFVCTLASPAFTAKDVLDRYLQRGSFETVLADEDSEQDPARWWSHSACRQECWQILNQWMWNLRLELGQQFSGTALQTTEFAPALQTCSVATFEPMAQTSQAATVVYGPGQWARPSFTGGFPGSAFRLPPDGSLLCPANHPLYPQERRPERHGSYRLLYAARIGDGRGCPLRAQCQESPSTTKPRRVSAMFWPLSSSEGGSSTAASSGSEPTTKPCEPLPLGPVLWRDWPRCQIRRSWLKLVRSETVSVTRAARSLEELPVRPDSPVLTRRQRAHWRLSWQERVVRKARPSTAPPLMVTLHGLPAAFAHSFGFGLLAAA